MPTIQGKIIRAFEPRTGTNDRGQWMIQEFLLESYDQPYTRKCVFSVFGADRLQQYNIKEGDDLAVDIDIDAREYNGRYYNSVRAWRATHIAAPQMQQMPPQGMVPPVAPTPNVASTMGASMPEAATPATPGIAAPEDPLMSGSNDDLPF